MGTIIYRIISTATPDELKNYIIKSDKIEKSYQDLKDNFKIYDINIREPFAIDDAMFADNVYYLESVGNMQLTLRCKNSSFEDLEDLSGAFKVYLKIYEIDVDSTVPIEEYVPPEDYILLETTDEKTFGKNTDRYTYFVYSFDGLKIDYAKTKVELYIFKNSPGKIAEYKEKDSIARITLFDVNMPKKRVPAKKFGFS